MSVNHLTFIVSTAAAALMFASVVSSSSSSSAVSIISKVLVGAAVAESAPMSAVVCSSSLARYALNYSTRIRRRRPRSPRRCLGHRRGIHHRRSPGVLGGGGKAHRAREGRDAKRSCRHRLPAWSQTMLRLRRRPPQEEVMLSTANSCGADVEVSASTSLSMRSMVLARLSFPTTSSQIATPWSTADTRLATAEYLKEP
ncbi:hypothetical protein SEVIR_3G360766v4 [Setaria viridis]